MNKPYKASLALLLATGQLLPAFCQEKVLTKIINTPPTASANRAPLSSGFRSSKLPRKSAGMNQSAGTGQSVNLLPDGRLLFIGGVSSNGPLATAEIKDPETDTTRSVAAGLHYPRAWHTATLLPDGKVLILGGIGSDGQIVDSGELFDPETQTFELIGNARSTPTPRAYHTATLLTDGRVLIVGGVSTTGKVLKQAELWDSGTGTAIRLHSGLKTARHSHTAALLRDGNVLIEGGTDRAGVLLEASDTYLAGAQRFSSKNTVDLETSIDPSSGEVNSTLGESPGVTALVVY